MIRAAAIALVLLALPGGAVAAGPQGYPRAANHACAIQRAAEARVEPGDPADARQVLRFFRGLAGAQRALVARLDPLEPPRADRPAYRRLVAAERAVIPLLDEAVAALDGGASPADLEKSLYPRVGRASARIDAAARRVGLRACVAQEG